MRFLFYFAPFLLLIESLDNTSSNGTTGNSVEVANESQWEKLNKIENELKHATSRLKNVKQELSSLEQIKPSRAKEVDLTWKVSREQHKYNELREDMERLIKNIETNMCNEKSLINGSQCYNYQKDLNAKSYLLDRAKSSIGAAIAEKNQYLNNMKKYEAKRTNLLDEKTKLEGNVKILTTELASAQDEVKNGDTEPTFRSKVKRSNKEVEKKVDDVVGKEKDNSADEKKNEEETTKDVGFPLWPIAIIVVVVVIVGGMFPIWRFVNILKKKVNGNKNTEDLPENLEPGTRYKVDKMPHNTPEVVKKILAEDAKPGSSCRFVKSTNGKSDEVRFFSKCKLGSKVDMDGNHHCFYVMLRHHMDSFEGPLKVKEMHPPLHRNIYEYHKTDVKFTNPLVHDEWFRVFTYGQEPGAQIMQKINPEFAENVENQHFTNIVDLLTRRNWQEHLWPVCGRSKLSDINDVQSWISMLSHHQYAFDGERAPFSNAHLRVIYDLLDKVQAIFEKEPLLVEMSAPVAVIGDIHGQYNMLHYMFATQQKGSLPGWAACRWVLLGNYVDRGDRSLEVIVFLFLLKLLNPNSICMLRGNHEDIKVNSTHGFGQELIERFGEEDGTRLLERFNEVFEMMPLACIISGAVLCVHGGISQNMLTFDPWNINQELKPVQSNKWSDKKLFDIMWANPLENFTKGSARKDVRKGRTADEGIRARDVYFGADDIKSMLERCGLQMLVRGHQRMMNGCKFGPGGHRILTVYSSTAPIEGKDYENFAGTVFFSETGRIETTFLMRGLEDQNKSAEFFLSAFNEHNDLVEYDVQCKEQPEGGENEPPIHEPGTGNIPPSGCHFPSEYDIPDPIEPE